MIYSFARVAAAVALNVEDYFAQKKRWWLRLHEKNGELNEMPCHQGSRRNLDAYRLHSTAQKARAELSKKHF